VNNVDVLFRGSYPALALFLKTVEDKNRFHKQIQGMAEELPNIKPRRPKETGVTT
jgi:hypothetical protein